MKIFNETIENVPEVEEDAKTVVDAVTGEAKQESEENAEENKEFFDAEALSQQKPFAGGEKQPKPEMPEMPKITLDESLFEDFQSEEISIEESVEVEEALNEAEIPESGRVATQTLVNALENGAVGALDVLNACFNYMSEDQVKEMVEMNFPFLLEEALEEGTQYNQQEEDAFWELAEKRLTPEQLDDLKKTLGKEEEAKVTEELITEGLMTYEEIWGQTEEDPFEFAKEFNLTCEKVPCNDCLPEETKYRFSGSPKDFDRARDAGYFYSMEIEENLEEGTFRGGRTPGSVGNDKWQALSNKGEKEPDDLWTQVMSHFDAEKDHPGVDFEGNILLYAATEEKLAKAKKIAALYGLDCQIKDLTGKAGVKEGANFVAKIVIPEDGIAESLNEADEIVESLEAKFITDSTTNLEK